MKTPQTVVVAWADTDAVIVKQGRVDIGERHTFKDVVIGKACIWKNVGEQSDVAKAFEYAAKENADETYEDGRYVTRAETIRRMYVFTYPTTEKDPLARARRDVVKQVSK